MPNCPACKNIMIKHFLPRDKSETCKECTEQFCSNCNHGLCATCPYAQRKEKKEVCMNCYESDIRYPEFERVYLMAKDFACKQCCEKTMEKLGKIDSFLNRK